MIKYFSLLCIFSTLNILSGEMRLDIDNVSHQSITIYYNDINGFQYKRIKTDTFMSMFIQRSPQQPDLLLTLKIGKILKDYITPRHCTYRKFTINPDPEIRKAEKLRRHKRKIRFK
jgi:hypothetical protein